MNYMTPFHVVMYTSITLVVFIVIVLFIYWIKTRKMLKQSNEHAVELKKELKKGMKVLCAGGLIGTYEGANKDNSIATISIADGTKIEVAFYSISSIIVNK